MNNKCFVEISIGELFDKVSILEIKKNKISQEEKLEFINKELLELYESNNILHDKTYDELYIKLKEINEKLWIIEDNIREKESKKCFDDEFIELARNVYKTNDKRSLVKLDINKKSNSSFREVKSYYQY